jgi:hypothetical protein
MGNARVALDVFKYNPLTSVLLKNLGVERTDTMNSKGMGAEW